MKSWQRLIPTRWSITAKISTALVAAAIVPLSFTTYYNFRTSLKTVEATEYQNLELLASSTSSRLDQLIVDTRQVVEQLSNDSQVISYLVATPAERKALEADTNRTLESFRLSNPDYIISFILDKNGICVASPSVPKIIGKNYQFRQYFQVPRQGQSYVSSILVGVTDKKPQLFFSAPVRSLQILKIGSSGEKVRQLQQKLQEKGYSETVDGFFGTATASAVRSFQQSQNLEANGTVNIATWRALTGQNDIGEIIGVAVLSMKGQAIWDIVDRIKVGSQGHAFLIDKEGIMIAHPDKSLLYKSLYTLPPDALKRVVADRRYAVDYIESLSNNPELAQAMIGAKSPGHTRYFSTRENRNKIAGFAPMENQPWVMGINEPEEQFAAPLTQLAKANGITVLLVGGAMAIGALVLARGIVKPIRALTGAAQALEKEDFDPKELNKVANSQDDIGQLVRVFLQMAQQVKVREEKLKQQVMELRIEIDQSKKERQVAEITETDYFQELQKKARKLRRRGEKKEETRD